MSQPWWKSAVIYQVYPRSFAGSGGPVGTLDGIRTHLDHLVWLGVDALWLSPFFRSPMADFGYDVSDYCDVDPLFGTLDDFNRLLADAHARGLKVLIDWVPNHTSDQHPWFVEARASRDSAKRDWYVWRDGSPDRPPNNWTGTFIDAPAWTWDRATGQWYLHCFLPAQPDLNWTNPQVVEAMHGVVRFWLDRGVDGFRIDVVQCMGKQPDLPDDPPEVAGIPHSALNDCAETHPLLRDLRLLFDSYPGARVMVGEVYLLSTARVARYYGAGDELHLAFNFPPLHAPWDAGAWRKRIERVVAELDPIDAWPTWVLSNHDNRRQRTRYGGSEARARAAAVLLLTLRGTPFLYQGEELGLEDALIPPARRVDPGGRDGCRAPLPWTGSSDHGWGVDDPWLPWPPEAGARNVDDLRADDTSILHLYQRLLGARRDSAALHTGTFSLLPAPDGALVWERATDDDRRLVAVNFTDAFLDIALSGDWIVEVASDGEGEGERASNRLGPDRAVVLRPAQLG